MDGTPFRADEVNGIPLGIIQSSARHLGCTVRVVYFIEQKSYDRLKVFQLALGFEVLKWIF